ncbi:MAG: succinyl-diaminopimelate desuccinylase [Pseudomonadales bacterium]
MTIPGVLELACALIERESVTPEDAGCQALLAEHLQAMGFTTRILRFAEVTNLWAHRGSDGPLLVLAGHTDVVPTGPIEQWRSPPFLPSIRDGYLYGRGAADMKSSLAAMLVATQRFVGQHPDHHGRIGFLLTSDEEGPALHGTREVIRTLLEEGVQPDYCVVGEPSSSEHLGDVIRVGRRGSLNGVLTVHGVQGHVAYPDQAVNPIHRLAPALAELAARRWDDGNEFFPPTTFQVSNLNAGTGADNVVPGVLTMRFNLRFNTEQSAQGLREQIESVLKRHQVDFELAWSLSGEPFLTRPGRLTDAVTSAVREVTGRVPQANTSGGTSDGRFIAPTGCEVVELGPVNATIHKIDERVAVADLEPLARIYERLMVRLLCP